MAKLTWTNNVTTWYEYELTDEELQMYNENEEEFFNNVDIYGYADIVREKEIPGDITFIDDEDDDSDSEDEE